MIHKPSLESLDVPQKSWARSVQPFCRLLDTNKQTDRQTDKPNLYIDIPDIFKFSGILFCIVKPYETFYDHVVLPKGGLQYFPE